MFRRMFKSSSMCNEVGHLTLGPTFLTENHSLGNWEAPTWDLADVVIT